MHYLDANKTAGEEARWQIHKNAACNPEQVLAATPRKVPTIRSPASHHENYPSQTNQTCRTLLEKQGRTHKWCTLMTPTYGRAKAGRPARTYIQQLCEDTGCRPEDLLEAMNDREKWQERVRDIRTGGTTWWWWWWLNSVLTWCLTRVGLCCNNKSDYLRTYSQYVTFIVEGNGIGDSSSIPLGKTWKHLFYE